MRRFSRQPCCGARRSSMSANRRPSRCNRISRASGASTTLSTSQGGVASLTSRSSTRISVPIGYAWDRRVGLGLDPDRRLQEVIRLVFQKFRELGSARQVLLWMTSQNIHFPYPSNGRTLTSFEWRAIRYRNVISILKNSFYAGVYAYGKSETHASIVDGRARKSYGHHKPMDAWEGFIKDHHEGYISWG